MKRIAMLVAALPMIVAFLAAGASPALAQDSFQALMEADVTAIEDKLQLTGENRAKVDAILQEGVTKRVEAMNQLGIVYGKRPSFGTLLKLRSQMDDIRTEEQTELAKFLSEDQMFVIQQVSDDSERKFRDVLLGS
jgi:hypothetical protein